MRTDERIRLMNEIINGMQVIKMYTWEKPFANLVQRIRRKEMAEIKKNSVIKAMSMSFSVFLTKALIYLCVLTYILTGNKLNSKYLYILTLFYEILREGLTHCFAVGITQIAEASISVKRIKDFLMQEEAEQANISLGIHHLTECKQSHSIKSLTSSFIIDSIPVGIHLKNISAKWIESTDDNSLERIHFDVSLGELVTVIGKVGSGKSTLLHVILQELPPCAGTVEVNGKISYASQEPWLFVGSVRQNILFGQDFDLAKYLEVVRVCALERDFSIFPYGDRTIVGERGVSLSGGQRARINLARAVYKDADIYLLDDPISAVDAHVGNHIFTECITGYLSTKCVVLVTHQLQYLKNCKIIYLLKDGFIDNCGTYTELESSEKGFSNLLEELKEQEEDKAKQQIQEEVRTRKRTMSADAENTDKKKLMDPTISTETKIKGKVVWPVYKSYLLAGGHWCSILTLTSIFVISQVLSSGCDYFLSIWVNVEQIMQEENRTLIHKNFDYSNKTAYPEYSDLQQYWLMVLTKDTCLITYSSFIILVIVLFISRSLIFYQFCIKASISLHNNMFDRIVHATMRFFNTNPSGRILNRFSQDINQVDELLPNTLADTLQIGLYMISITILVATVSPLMMIPTCVILVIFYLIRVVFIATSRDLKRFEAITRSPVYSHLTATLQGLTTIRAFGAQEILKKEFDNYQNTYTSAYFMFFTANRTFGFWLDLHTVVFLTIVTYGFLVTKTETFGGSVGLAITQAMSLCGWFQWGIRQWSAMENTMTSVERINEYTNLQAEDDFQAKGPPKDWPENGDLLFNNVCLRYSSEEPDVLRNVTFSIKSSEKVGIVGRTGAGKSSIIAALFRLTQTEGRILIDNIDTKTVPLNILRSSISIIPQEPVLFSGTLRKNLDPFDEYSDQILWNALEEVQLKGTVLDLLHGLESKISEGGSNFSVGQRQLLCLARAIVRNNNILVLDEATANVDPHTDALIQKTIRRKFSNCTVLTIAHRLHTIMDSDKVLVMDAGKVVEFGHPHELLQNTQGVFFELVNQTGKAMANNLKGIAKREYQYLPEK